MKHKNIVITPHNCCINYETQKYNTYSIKLIIIKCSTLDTLAIHQNLIIRQCVPNWTHSRHESSANLPKINIGQSLDNCAEDKHERLTNHQNRMQTVDMTPLPYIKTLKTFVYFII
jgi:hypothetical protein